MASRKVEIGPTGETVRERIRSIRKGRGLTLEDVSRRMTKVGRPFSTSTLFDIENGGRRVDVDDLMAFAVAFDVTAITLLMPSVESGEDDVVVTGFESIPASNLWHWLRGSSPIPATDNRRRSMEFSLASWPTWETSLPWDEPMAEYSLADCSEDDK